MPPASSIREPAHASLGGRCLGGQLVDELFAVGGGFEAEVDLRARRVGDRVVGVPAFDLSDVDRPAPRVVGEACARSTKRASAQIALTPSWCRLPACAARPLAVATRWAVPLRRVTMASPARPASKTSPQAARPQPRARWSDPPAIQLPRRSPPRSGAAASRAHRRSRAPAERIPPPPGLPSCPAPRVRARALPRAGTLRTRRGERPCRGDRRARWVCPAARVLKTR